MRNLQNQGVYIFKIIRNRWRIVETKEKTATEAKSSLFSMKKTNN